MGLEVWADGERSKERKDMLGAVRDQRMVLVRVTGWENWEGGKEVSIEYFRGIALTGDEGPGVFSISISWTGSAHFRVSKFKYHDPLTYIPVSLWPSTRPLDPCSNQLPFLHSLPSGTVVDTFIYYLKSSQRPCVVGVMTLIKIKKPRPRDIRKFAYDSLARK